MKVKCWLLLTLVIFLYLENSVFSLAQELLPKYLAKERQQFLENQINAQNKIFLNQLQKALDDLSKINEETLALIKVTFPKKGKKRYLKVIKNIEREAEEINKNLLGPQKPANNLESFITIYFTDSQKVKMSLQGLIMGYKTSQYISTYIVDDLKTSVLAEGPYHYYQLCLNSFEANCGENLEELLGGSMLSYQYLSELAQKHKIKNIKEMLQPLINRFQKALPILDNTLISKIKLTNQSWARETILKTLSLTREQLKLNKEFTLALLKKIETIPIPRQPILPDLKITSIEFVLPPKIKIGKMVKIIAEVKNDADLPAQRSRALIIFPNGRKKARPVPKLAPQQTCKVTWRYKLSKKGQYIFRVIANYDGRAWEAQKDNNTTQRSLIIPSHLQK